MKSFKQFFSEIINEEKHPIVKEYDALKKHDIDTLRSMAKKHGRIVDVSGLKTKDHAITHILRSKYGDKKVDQAFGFNEEVELDEVSSSTLRSYIDKSRADKKAAMKDRTDAEKNVKQYGMASDKKERDDAARRVVNRSQGISVANQKLGTYPADKAKAKVMAREETEQIDEISTELKKRYIEKGADDVVDRFTGRGKYERPRNPAHFTKTGRVKKSALNRPEAIKYREKLDNRRDIVNKVSQEVHGKKRFGEEVELDENTIPYNIAAVLQHRHEKAAEHHKKNGNMKGYSDHMNVAGKIEDAMINAGHHMPVRSKRIEAASDKAFKEHPHNPVKN